MTYYILYPFSTLVHACGTNAVSRRWSPFLTILWMVHFFLPVHVYNSNSIHPILHNAWLTTEFLVFPGCTCLRWCCFIKYSARVDFLCHILHWTPYSSFKYLWLLTSHCLVHSSGRDFHLVAKVIWTVWFIFYNSCFIDYGSLAMEYSIYETSQLPITSLIVSAKPFLYDLYHFQCLAVSAELPVIWKHWKWYILYQKASAETKVTGMLLQVEW
jgi:hypothetical protein